MKIQPWCALIPVCAVLSSSCKEESGLSITGEVFDVDGEPLSGVHVSAYGVADASVKDGSFRLDGVDIKGLDRVVIDLQKEGYFDSTVGSRATGGSPHIRVALSEKELWGSVDAEEGGQAAGAEVSVTFPPGAFRGSDGGDVEGEVSIFGAFASPDQPNFGNAMPGGDFSAEDSAGDDGVLTSLGAVTIAAEAENGQELDLQLEADMCLNIPASMLDFAPDTVPLWILDGTGRWQETGEGLRDGDQYCFFIEVMGSVNCDLFSRTALVTGRVCEGGDVVPGAAVQLQQGETSADNAGVYGALVPADQDFTLSAEQGSVDVPAIPPGETAEVDIGDCGDGPIGITGEFTASDPSGCTLGYEVSAELVSMPCPDCDYTLAQIYAIDYVWSSALSASTGCGDGSVTDAEMAEIGTYYAQYWDYSMGYWAVSEEEPYGAPVVIGYGYVGDYAYGSGEEGFIPSIYGYGMEGEVTASGLSWSYDYYGVLFEGRLDFGGGGGGAADSPTSLPNSGVSR